MSQEFQLKKILFLKIADPTLNYMSFECSTNCFLQELTIHSFPTRLVVNLSNPPKGQSRCDSSSPPEVKSPKTNYGGMGVVGGHVPTSFIISPYDIHFLRDGFKTILKSENLNSCKHRRMHPDAFIGRQNNNK